MTTLVLVFHNVKVNAAKLDTMSLEELYVLAGRMGLTLPEGLERLFVIEELAEAIADEREERGARGVGAMRMDDRKFFCPGSDELEAPILRASEFTCRSRRFYNETSIRIIARDPSWAFAYWDLSDAERGLIEAKGLGLVLRVETLDTLAHDKATPGRSAQEAQGPCFDIPVSVDDFQWFINLPSPGLRIRLCLCVKKDGAQRLRVLARSNVVQSPRQSLASEPSAEQLALLRLSGLEDFHIDGDPEHRTAVSPGSGEAKA